MDAYRYVILKADYGDELVRFNRYGRDSTIDPEVYQNLALDFLNKNLTRNDVLIDCCLGLAGEVGEVVDAFKKWKYQGHTDYNSDKIADELGDICWYVAVMSTMLGKSFHEIMKNNILKLNNRYPNGFDPVKSMNRSEENAEGTQSGE